MNRFDESFNDIDRVSGRPFSSGHPDGVWIISIVYLLLVLGTLLRVVITAATGQLTAEAIVPLVATSLMYIPPIVLLFLRKASAFVWLGGLAILYAAGAVVGGLKLHQAGQLSGAALAGMSVGVAFQLFIAIYAFGLKKDSLLR